MKNKKRIAVLAAVGLAVLCISVLFIVFSGMGKEHTVSLYFKNLSENNIEPETRVISDTDISSDEQLLKAVTEELESGPETNASLLNVLDDVKIKSCSLKDNCAYVDLSSEYYNKSNMSRLLMKSSLVYTLTALSFVDNVALSADGIPIDNGSLLNRRNVLLDPDIAPEKINYRTMTLYFADSAMTGLCEEQRLMEVKQSQTIESQILDQLLLGPENSNLVSPIPSSTKLIKTTTENGICYVNLSSAFLNRGAAESAAKLQIYSVVNSLTALDDVDSVQFYIEGEKVTETVGGTDISKELKRDESLIISKE